MAEPHEPDESNGALSLTPELERVDVYYRSANLAPVIKKFGIAQPSLDDAIKGVNKPSRPVTWEAADPDSDSLSFELFFRGEWERSWQKVGRDVTDSRYDLDTRALPDGWYELRLVASGEPTEPAGAAPTTEQVSRPFMVDNTAPAVTGLEAQVLSGGGSSIANRQSPIAKRQLQGLPRQLHRAGCPLSDCRRLRFTERRRLAGARTRGPRLRLG